MELQLGGVPGGLREDGKREGERRLVDGAIRGGEPERDVLPDVAPGGRTDNQAERSPEPAVGTTGTGLLDQSAIWAVRTPSAGAPSRRAVPSSRIGQGGGASTSACGAGPAAASASSDGGEEPDGRPGET